MSRQGGEKGKKTEVVWRKGSVGVKPEAVVAAVGNAVQRVANNPSRAMAQALRELEPRFKNQES